MEKVYEELDEVKTENEKLRVDLRNKTELLDNLKKVKSEQLIEIGEAKSLIEKQGFELQEKTAEIVDLKRTNEDLQRCLREKDSILKRVNETNDKLRANGEDKHREFEEESRKMMSALDETSEKNIDLEQINNVFRAEIEGLKDLLAAAEKKKMEVEKSAKALKEMRGRDDLLIKMEEEKNQVEEKLKWKKEQFRHLEEAYEKLQNQFKVNKKEREEERSSLLDDIYSLQTKLDSQTRITEDLEKKLHMCNCALTQEETRRKHLEIQVSEFKSRYEDTFAEYQDARTQLDDLSSKRDEEVAALRQSLSTKQTYFNEMKYENGKLEQENKEILASLKELQEATIQGSGNSALTKLKSKFRNLENVHKNCSANLRSKEAEWSSKLEKMADEIHDYKSQLQNKETTLKEIELELENCHSSRDKLRLQYEEIWIMFLVLSNTVSEAQSKLANVKDEHIKEEKREEESSSLLMKQLEQKNTALANSQLEIEEEREKVTCLLKRIEMLDVFEEHNLEMEKEVKRYKEMVEESSRFQTQMKEKLKEAEDDYEEKLLQVCDALDNTNADLVAEREKVVALTSQIESFDLVKAKNLVTEQEIQRYKEMLEESEKCQILLEEKISQLETDSEEKIRIFCSKIDTANAKLAEEIEKNASLINKTESHEQKEEHTQKELDNYKKLLEESTKSQLLLQEKLSEVENNLGRKLADVSEALETANSELFDKTSEAHKIEFKLWIWKSIAKRLKDELEQSHNLRKRVEASLLEQVAIGEAMKQERNKLARELKTVTLSNSEKETLLQMLKDKDKILKELQKEVESLEQESLNRELEYAIFADITAERKLQNKIEILQEALEHRDREFHNELEQKQNEVKILTKVETEEKQMMIKELEGEISNLTQKIESLDQSVAHYRQESAKLEDELATKQKHFEELTTEMQRKLRTSEAENTELVKEVLNLSRERQNLLCFIGEFESGMLKVCDEDRKLMKALENITECCYENGKENKKIDIVESQRFAGKLEDVAANEDRSPFRQLNQ